MRNGIHRLLLALFFVAVPLFASSPEYQVGATAPAAAPYYRHSPAIATDGTDFFAVWYDGRTPGRGAIIGTRLTRAGEVLDPLGIRISTTPGYIRWPAAVWDGSAYVVVWTEPGDELYAARVGRDGRIVTAPRLLATHAQTTGSHYAESNGDVTVIAYRKVNSSRPASHLVVLDGSGNTIRQEQLATTVPDLYGGFSVAATPSSFAIAWATSEAAVWASALGGDGRVIQPARPIGTGNNVAIASDGSEFVLATAQWSQAEYQSVLSSRKLDDSLDSASEPVAIAGDQLIESISLFWRGDRYEAIAGHKPEGPTPYGLLSIELDRDGRKLSSRRRGDIDVVWAAPTPTAVTNGSDVAVAYTDDTGDFTSIFGRVYRGSAPEPDVQQLLSWSGNAHEDPRIVAGPSGHLAAWTENGGAYATRIDANGHSLDGRGLLLAATNATDARVSFDGTNYVAAWIDGFGTIRVRYIAPATGATVAEAQVPVRASSGLALATSADATYVAFHDGFVHVLRIPHATHEADIDLQVSPATMDASDFAMAWNGTELLVAWNEIVYGAGSPPYEMAVRIHAARVSRHLGLLDPAPLLVADQTNQGTYGVPAVASDGNDWLVVASRGNEVVARRVLRSGNLEGTGPAKLADGLAGDVTWDGAQYAIAFRADQSLLLGAVPAAGALQLTRRAFVANEVLGTTSVARTPGGVSVIYLKLSFLPEHTGVQRSYFRVMDFGPRGRAVRR